jgi:hypothetical protein
MIRRNHYSRVLSGWRTVANIKMDMIICYWHCGHNCPTVHSAQWQSQSLCKMLLLISNIYRKDTSKCVVWPCIAQQHIRQSTQIRPTVSIYLSNPNNSGSGYHWIPQSNTILLLSYYPIILPQDEELPLWWWWCGSGWRGPGPGSPGSWSRKSTHFVIVVV